MKTISRITLPHSAKPETTIEWEETDCLLCGSANWTVVLEATDPDPHGLGLRFPVSQCRDCGLRFTNPRPGRLSMEQFYPPDYQPHRPSAAEKQSRWRKRYPSLPRWLVRKHEPLTMQGEGRLLDFGCGGGLFLQQMQRLGWTVTGVDVSRETVCYLRDALGIEAFAGSLPHPQLQSRRFDVITMWHSLEHVHCPVTVLKAARDLLAPGGKLIVAVPNIASLPFRWFASDWYGLDLPRHLIHFTPATLRKMLEINGFDVPSVRMVRHSSWLRMSARLAMRNKHHSVWNRLLLCKPYSRLVSWYTYWRNQTDCIMATATRNDALGG